MNAPSGTEHRCPNPSAPCHGRHRACSTFRPLQNIGTFAAGHTSVPRSCLPSSLYTGPAATAARNSPFGSRPVIRARPSAATPAAAQSAPPAYSHPSEPCPETRPLRIVRRKLIRIPRRRRQMRDRLAIVAMAQRRPALAQQLAITAANRWSCAPAHITVLPSRETP